MIRRNIADSDRDRTVVKWSLIAAAFALSAGSLAEATLTHATDADTSIVVEKTVELDTGKVVRIAG